MKNLIFLLVFLFLVSTFISNAQTSLQWAKCFGGYGAETPAQIIQTADGGFITIGSTTADGGDVTGLHGLSDFWLVKTDSNGILLWQKCYGGTADDKANAIDFTLDGGYIIAGYTYSKNGDVTGVHDTTLNSNADYSDGWVIKIDSAGTKQWAKCYGGYKDDVFNSITHTSDGGYIMTGSTTSNDGNVSGLHQNSQDIWVLKIDSNGSIQWQKCLGGTQEEEGIKVIQINDGGYLVAGNSYSSDGDVIDHHGTNSSDFWLVKLDAAGTKKWTKSFGGPGYESLGSMINTNDDGCLMFGTTGSSTGDVFGSHGNGEAWLVKSDSLGNLVWQRCIGGSGSDEGISLSQTSDGGYILLGMSWSQDGEVITHNDSSEFWLVKLNSAGYMQWQEFHGGTGNETPASVIESSDGGYAFTGFVYMNGGEVTGNHGANQDFWVVKRYPGNTSVPEISDTIFKTSVFPNPFSTKTILFIETKYRNYDGMVYIYDVLGREVRSSVINEPQTIINKDGLSQGVYFYKVEMNTKTNKINIATGKLVVE